MSTGLMSHFHAGSGAVCVKTSEEKRFLDTFLAESGTLDPDPDVGWLPNSTPVAYAVAGTNGPVRNCRTMKNEVEGGGLAAGYKWASEQGGRVLFVYDWHVLFNAPGHWRTLIDMVPELRSPPTVCKCGQPVTVPASEESAECEECGEECRAHASLVVFVGPVWDFQAINPLDGVVPIIPFDPPDREGIRASLDAIRPLNGDADQVVDALCGLRGDTAEQVASEVLARTGGKYDIKLLSERKCDELRRAGMEVLPAVLPSEYGGMGRLNQDFRSRVIPFMDDKFLAVKRMLFSGVQGTGKSYGAQLLAGLLSCPCVRISLSSLQSKYVGEGGEKTRHALATTSVMAKHAPLIVVLDEVDTIAKTGNDGGAAAAQWTALIDHLQTDTSRAIYIGTTNYYDRVDAALSQRFGRGYFLDLPAESERRAVCEIHYRRVGCANPAESAKITSKETDGYSCRELAEQIIPDVTALSNRKVPTIDVVKQVLFYRKSCSVTQAEQLAAVRKACGLLIPANDPDEKATVQPKGRRVAV